MLTQFILSVCGDISHLPCTSGLWRVPSFHHFGRSSRLCKQIQLLGNTVWHYLQPWRLHSSNNSASYKRKKKNQTVSNHYWSSNCYSCNTFVRLATQLGYTDDFSSWQKMINSAYQGKFHSLLKDLVRPWKQTKNTMKACLWKHKAFQWHIIWSEATRLKGLTQVRQWGDRKETEGFSTRDETRKGNTVAAAQTLTELWVLQTVLCANIHSSLWVWCVKMCVCVRVYKSHGLRKQPVTQW